LNLVSAAVVGTDWFAKLAGITVFCACAGLGCRASTPGTLNDTFGVSDTGSEIDAASVSGLTPGIHDFSLEHDGFARTYRLYVPTKYEDGEPSPLVFVLHGGGGNAERLEGLGFEPLADRNGALIVYPQGVENNWADGRGTTDAELAGADDVSFLAALIDEISTTLSIDSDQVFVTGVSNGGVMSHRLACDLADRFGAVASVIGSLATNYREECRPSEPIGVMSIRGTEDPFINFEGGDAAHDDFPRLGDGGLIESSESARRFWAEQNGCSEPVSESLEPINPEDPTRVTRIEHADCTDGVSVVYYEVEGMGHTWPPNAGVAPRVSGPASTQLNATELIWAFFFGR
jgi:polyhydroxybutyrate depolymerase